MTSAPTRTAKSFTETIADRLADLLQQQHTVSAEMSRLQEHQKTLVHEVTQLVAGSELPHRPNNGPGDLRARIENRSRQLGEVSLGADKTASILDCLAPDEGACAGAKAAI